MCSFTFRYTKSSREHSLSDMMFYICSVDIAAVADIVWEGYMGANVPAYLFKKAKNIETSAEPRQQQLSTGTFLVQDMKCRNCSTAFGWSYLKAWNQVSLCKHSTSEGFLSYLRTDTFKLVAHSTREGGGGALNDLFPASSVRLQADFHPITTGVEEQDLPRHHF